MRASAQAVAWGCLYDCRGLAGRAHVSVQLLGWMGLLLRNLIEVTSDEIRAK